MHYAERELFSFSATIISCNGNSKKKPAPLITFNSAAPCKCEKDKHGKGGSTEGSPLGDVNKEPSD